MELLTRARERIDPLLFAVRSSIPEHEVHMAGFFATIDASLRHMRDEADLAQLFVDLSTTAFQGFVFTTEQAERVDALLAECESIALTMSADGDPH